MIYLKGLSSREHASLHVFCSPYLIPIIATRVLPHVYSFFFALFIHFKANWAVPDVRSAVPRFHLSPYDQNEVTGFSLIKKQRGVSKKVPAVYDSLLQTWNSDYFPYDLLLFFEFFFSVYCQDVNVSSSFQCTETKKYNKKNPDRTV